MKKIVAALLSAVMSFSMFTDHSVSVSGTKITDIGLSQNVAATSETSGKCGDNVHWEIQGDKLIITGSGEMYEFDTIAAAPWNSDRSHITEVSIADGVTTVAPCAFANMSMLSKVNIPSNAKYIGRIAFSNCTSLRSVDVPSSVEFLGKGAFKNCSSLQAVNIFGVDTEIKGGKETISSSGSQYDTNYYFNGVICGYNGSKAQSFAKECGYRFQTLGPLSVQTTTRQSVITTTTTTTTTTAAYVVSVSAGLDIVLKPYKTEYNMGE